MVKLREFIILVKRFNKALFFSVLLVSMFSFLFTTKSSASILNDWQDENAYKPNPILFLHGFGTGSSESWNKIIDGDTSFDGLSKYFTKYTQVSTRKDSSSHYLERIAFNDPNGSIDTYTGGKLNPQGNTQGWADKVQDRMRGLLELYKFKNIPLKINFVCHSMGGLAAREYATNSKYGNSFLNIDKIITIGTPHAGTPLANIKEEVVSDVHKYIIEYPPFERAQFSLTFESSNEITGFLKGEYKIDIHGEALQDMAVASQFLKTLNYDISRAQPASIKNFSIFGWVNSPEVNGIFLPYYIGKEGVKFSTLGDLIVPVDSQKGYDVMTYYPKDYWVWNTLKAIDVNLDHFQELESADTVKKILTFLDSAKPELEIILPDPSQVTEIHETSIHLQGKVYKEYLPADSILIITINREDDGYVLPKQTTLLNPSDLWIPNNQDSPVAEFDELLTLPGNGTYKISCQVQNPGGEVSGAKDVRVKVAVAGPVISVISPVPNAQTVNKRPLIKVRINSPTNINIDLSSIKMIMDGAILSSTITPSTGGSDIIISFTPVNNLNLGLHTIVVNVSDMNRIPAEEKTWAFTIQGQNPVVTDKLPKSGGIIPNISPINIQARIYSPDNIDIDLSSVEMFVNDVKTAPVISLINNSEALVSYVLSDSQVPGKTITVRISAKDKYGISASSGEWSFYIFEEVYPQKIFWEKIRVDSNTFLNNARYINDYQIVAPAGEYPKYNGVDVYAVTYIKFDMSKFIIGGMLYPKVYLLWNSYQDSPWGAPITVTVYENTGSTDEGASISLGFAYDSQVLNETKIYYFDITAIWNAWITGGKQNNGLILKVTSGLNRSVASYGNYIDTKAVGSFSSASLQAVLFGAEPLNQNKSKKIKYPPIF